MNARYPMTG